MKPAIFALVSALGIGIFATDAAAQYVCMPSEELKAGLVDWYGEYPVDPQSEDNQQIWASDVTGTWTMVRFMSDGNACTIAQGDKWMGGLTADQLLASLE